MATEWDLNEGVGGPAVDTQPSATRVRLKTATVSVIAVTAGTLFSTAAAPIVSHDPGWVSTNVIEVRTVPREPSSTPAKPRKARELFSPDAQAGVSTRRLADAILPLVTTAPEPDVDVDYSFG
jgi:hypothetical protein